MPLQTSPVGSDPEVIYPKGVKLRDFGDHEQMRKDVLESTKNAFAAKFPQETASLRMDLDDIGYDEKKTKFGIADTKKALLEGGRLAAPLYGTIRLTDKLTNRPIETKKVLLANVPVIGERGSYVIGGNEITTNSQSRLRPGIYARKKENGDLESHLNPKSGTGPMIRLYMEPDTGVYRANIDKATIKLYPVLHSLGVSDEDLAKQWGPDILKANQLAYDRMAPAKFYSKLMRNRADNTLPDDQKAKAVLEKLGQMKVDPEVTNRTLGEPIDSLSPQVLAKASTKLLKIHRGEAEQDDRDSLANKYFMSTDDFLKERIARDHGGLLRAAMWKINRDRNLDALKPGYFSPQIHGLFVGNPLSSPIGGTNPMEVRDQSLRVIQSGEGGTSQDSISTASRNVQPSQAFFLDPIRSSESTAIGTDLRFAHGVKKGDDGHIYAPFRNKRTGKIEYLNPAQVSQKTVGFPKSQSLSLFAH